MCIKSLTSGIKKKRLLPMLWASFNLHYHSYCSLIIAQSQQNDNTQKCIQLLIQYAWKKSPIYYTAFWTSDSRKKISKWQKMDIRVFHGLVTICIFTIVQKNSAFTSYQWLKSKAWVEWLGPSLLRSSQIATLNPSFLLSSLLLSTLHFVL